ncbi:divergent polysaccharide deacetylase family protein [Candidatus Sulfurimonas marisnigri]|uniref:Divergent polysaccharide deacetylase family protein n=1 Tax=Candidatus Sulfurimonas marisnigri TaxID=2740405 RepID=A0A7S7M1F8_9BACT|nr:divergent polysaccharide deacetylase family protein [Candidatus Sulfurimonas marisnigri]QOY55175.1 divergent polysaccharide deacetylase family protein [Candidatus Sulfurimonas marisnigri]
MTKRKNKSSKKGSNTLVYIAWTLSIVAIILGSLLAGYYIGYKDAKNDMLKKEIRKDEKKLAMLRKLEAVSAKKDKSSVSSRLKEVLKKDVKKELEKEPKIILKSLSASHEYDGETLPKAPKRKIKIVSTKPKLAIIIDDVSVKSHVNAIKSLNLPLTMSFLPPSEFRPNSAILASHEKFYMVHLPMEAKSFTKEEPFTLRVADSQTKISKRIASIRKLFPNVKYINNHTGSKFTSNELAVNKLIYALKKQNINFIDSRTIASTKVPMVMKNYGKKYMARDIFLDHEMEKKYVKKQIKEAIKVAKLHGTAIAIGHPHANTIMALSESKKLFEDVELVLIDRLY